VKEIQASEHCCLKVALLWLALGLLQELVSQMVMQALRLATLL